jgi:hypothetical protein
MKCKLHPTYKAIRKPRISKSFENIQDCNCWKMYLEKHADEKFPNFISGKMMSHNDWANAAKEAAQNLMKHFPNESHQTN